jgi:hypothetical protein
MAKFYVIKNRLTIRLYDPSEGEDENFETPSMFRMNMEEVCAVDRLPISQHEKANLISAFVGMNWDDSFAVAGALIDGVNENYGYPLPSGSLLFITDAEPDGEINGVSISVEEWRGISKLATISGEGLRVTAISILRSLSTLTTEQAKLLIENFPFNL